jgi:hypothetical protein
MLNDAQLAAAEMYGPFSDTEASQWVAITHIWAEKPIHPNRSTT